MLLLISLLIAATGALAVDVAYWLRDARTAQNDADSIVLAGVLELPEPGTGSATTIANTWASRNNTPAGELTCCTYQDRDGDGYADTIRATVNRESKSIFAKLVGLGDPTIHRDAAAMRIHASGSSVMPWAVFCENQPPASVEDCGLDPDELYELHEADQVSPGNFNALGVDCRGQSCYTNSIQNEGGSNNVYSEGDSVYTDTKPGNMGSNNCDALYTRVISTEGDTPTCNSGKYNGSCDVSSKAQLISKGIMDANGNLLNPDCERRVVVIPITEYFDQGRDQVEIYYLGTFYIGGWVRKGPWRVDINNDGSEEMIWGFWLENATVSSAWDLVVDPNNSGSPLAPLVAVLID
jgi:hypothetical protein